VFQDCKLADVETSRTSCCFRLESAVNSSTQVFCGSAEHFKPRDYGHFAAATAAAEAAAF
jgi:hypothetical protein